jgi:integrase
VFEVEEPEHPGSKSTNTKIIAITTKPFFLFLFTGLRRNEALALRWTDIDLLGAQLSVNRTMQFIHNQVSFKPPKTKTSRRSIALTPATCTVLRLHREKQNMIRQQTGLEPVTDNDLVFCQYEGNPYLPNSITHAWIKLTRRCGLGGIRLHDARHTHASLLLKQGIHPKVVQERLGHAGIAITLDLYSHTVKGMQKAAAAGFDDAVIGDGSQTNSLDFR